MPDKNIDTGPATGFLRFAEVSLGDGGLPACLRCAPAVAFSPRSGADVIADALLAIERWDRRVHGPGPNLSFVGAEPFSHLELPGVIFAASEAGASRLRLRTGAEALSVTENAAGVIHAGVRHLEIVLLGGAELHDALRGRPGAFAALGAGVRAFVDAASDQSAEIALTGLVPVCRHNLEDLPATVAVLSRLGVGEVVLEIAETPASAVDAGSWIASACDTGVVNGTWVSVRCARPLVGVPRVHEFSVSTPVDLSAAPSQTGRS